MNLVEIPAAIDTRMGPPLICGAISSKTGPITCGFTAMITTSVWESMAWESFSTGRIPNSSRSGMIFPGSTSKTRISPGIALPDATNPLNRAEPILPAPIMLIPFKLCSCALERATELVYKYYRESRSLFGHRYSSTEGIGFTGKNRLSTFQAISIHQEDF